MITLLRSGTLVVDARLTELPCHLYPLTTGPMTATETILPDYADLDLRETDDVIAALLASQQQAVDAVKRARTQLGAAVDKAAQILRQGEGRLVMVGAGASGRLAVQDGAEMWPTFGWPAERLLLSMAGGRDALLHSIEGVEDDADDARRLVAQAAINTSDVVICVAASGRSPWTCEWAAQASARGALTIGLSGNAEAPLLDAVNIGIQLSSGAEVLAGSTRMAAGTAQKIALNVFSTSLMVRLNRTYGNLMVDMAASNTKLDVRRIVMLQTILPNLAVPHAERALADANGHVKQAVLIAKGLSVKEAVQLLDTNEGSLRAALDSLPE